MATKMGNPIKEEEREVMVGMEMGVGTAMVTAMVTAMAMATATATAMEIAMGMAMEAGTVEEMVTAIRTVQIAMGKETTKVKTTRIVATTTTETKREGNKNRLKRNLQNHLHLLPQLPFLQLQSPLLRLQLLPP
jgi:hypothetical protein